MKNCKNCGTQLADDAKMCPNCGAILSYEDNQTNNGINSSGRIIFENNANYNQQNNEKEDNSKISVGVLITMFLLGFVGLQLIAVIVSLLIQVPLFNFYDESFIAAVNGISKGMGNKILAIIDSVALFTYYFITFIIFIIVIGFSKNTREYLKKAFKKSAILEGLVIALIMLGATMIYGVISTIIYPHDTNNNQAGIESSFAVMPLLSFFCIVIFAPFCEELTYRAGLFGLIAKKSKIAAYIVTILVFALIHFDFTAKDMINELVNLPSYLIGAGLLCYAYSRKDNIFTAIFAHLFYNGIQFLLMLSIFA